MKLRVLLLLTVSGILAFVCVVRAQEQTPTTPAPPTGSVYGQPAVDTQGIRNYLLGPGDVLDVRVFGQPELSAVVDVDSDGNISSLPFLEAPIRAKCRTEKEVQRDVAVAYGKYLKNPQVSVRIAERKSRQPATVFGAVRTPQQVRMLRRVRLNELLAVSGGLTERSSGTVQILHTEPVMCPEPGEEADALPVEGANLPMSLFKISDLKAGKAEGNPFIRPGDYVQFMEGEPVYITGSVNAPKEIYGVDNLTLSRALGIVGGPRKEAKTSEIKIYRRKPGSTETETIVVDLVAIKKNQAPDPLLRAFDIVDVPEANPFSKGRIGSTFLGLFSGGLSSAVQHGVSVIP
jgi:polysaccharide export outer membrane protein